MKTKKYRNLKTHEDVMSEMNKRQQEIERLSADLEKCESIEVRMLIADRMVEICDEMAEIDSRNRKILLKQFKKYSIQTLKQSLKDSFKRVES
jgi:hypothetical protein